MPFQAVDLEEQRRLAECVREPIRTPGTIQPHGALLGIDDSGQIALASENCADILGMDAAALLTRPAADIFEPLFLSRVSSVLAGSANPIRVRLSDTDFDAIAHRSGDLVMLEFEPTTPDDGHSSAALYSAIHRLARLGTIEEVRKELVCEVRNLTGFDRVMLYKFHDDDHGEVVAEEVAEGMEPYLGLHFPASDIPAQARQLYITKLSRAIVSTEKPAVPLVTLDGSRVGAAIDLSEAELRAVSPYHLQFMRNMGQASTLSFSLIRDGKLIGMITCAHRTERSLPFLLRRGLEILANQSALQIDSMLEIARLTRDMEARRIRARLETQLERATDLGDALLHGETTVLDLVPADGVAVHIDGTLTTWGSVPHTIDRLAEVLDGGVIATDALQQDLPELAALLPKVAGALVLPIGGTGDYLAFLRREVAQTVDWLGDLTDANRTDPLSPRVSFSAWTQSVTGTSLPWGEAVEVVEELGRDIGAALLSRAESALAALALRDPLTGLPNRRLLMERLEHALTRSVREVEVSLLFVDIDNFKLINDTDGHEVGDEVLVEIGERLSAVARSHDTVARFGGDEFVVLCEDASLDDADAIASRIAEALREPIAGRVITASIGVAAASQASTAAHVLQKADSAMYRAKAGGRNRASR